MIYSAKRFIAITIITLLIEANATYVIFNKRTAHLQ